jgi:hypothetical protein
MVIKYSDFPEWSFDVNEVSAGVYEATATDSQGRRVQSKGTDVDLLIEEVKEGVQRIRAELSRHGR